MHLFEGNVNESCKCLATSSVNNVNKWRLKNCEKRRHSTSNVKVKCRQNIPENMKTL